MQPVDRRRIELVGRRAHPIGVYIAAVHVEKQPAQRLLHIALSAPRPVEPEVHLRLVHRVHVIRLVGRAHLSENLRVFLAELGAADPWSDQHQLGDALTVLQSKINREAGADRATHEVRRLQLQLVHQRKQVSHGRPSLGRQLGLAKPTHVRTHHIEVFGEGSHLRLPHARVGDTRVQEHDRQARALALVVDSGPVELCVHHTNAVSRALNFNSVSSSSRAGSESGITPTPA